MTLCSSQKGNATNKTKASNAWTKQIQEETNVTIYRSASRLIMSELPASYAARCQMHRPPRAVGGGR